MRRSLMNGPIVLTALFASSACSSELAPSAVLVTDSAGVVMRVIADGAQHREYQLSDPLWVIGGADATPESELFGVVGAVMFSNGDVAVANGGTNELKLFDANGTHLGTAGREGEGPGEFTDISLVGRLDGDSILTFDWSQGRIQVFDRALELGRVSIVPTPESFGPFGVSPVAVFPDGRFLARGAEMAQEYPREGLRRHIYLMSPPGQVVDSIGPMVGGRVIWMSGEQWPPFERKAAFALHTASIYTATSESSEFRRFSERGEVLEIVRGGLASRPPTQADVDAALEGRPPGRGADPWVSELLPYWGEFFVDETGATWRSRYAAPTDTELRWLIVEAHGEGVGTLTTSSRFKPLYVDEGIVLAVEKDSLDIERIALYELHR